MGIQQLIKCSLITVLAINVVISSETYASGKKYKSGKNYSKSQSKGHSSCKHKNTRGNGHHKHDRNCGGDVENPTSENPTTENQLLNLVLGETYHDLSISNGNTVRIPASQGEKGEQGIAGPQGPIGMSGANGTNGTNGSQGVQGLQGPRGFSGAQGVKGDQGVAGAQGAIGLTGAQGAKGDQGIAGAQGAKGEQGMAGAQGAIGLTGAQGAKGDQGIAGVQGAKGEQGNTGAQGSKGDQGITGAQGTKGDQGIAGAQGAIGLTGAQGEKGEQGVAGERGPIGFTGPQGISGTDGKDGTTFPTSPQDNFASDSTPVGLCKTSSGEVWLDTRDNGNCKAIISEASVACPCWSKRNLQMFEANLYAYNGAAIGEAHYKQNYTDATTGETITSISAQNNDSANLDTFVKVDSSGAKSCGVVVQDPASRIFSLYATSDQISQKEYEACNQGITATISRVNIENLHP